MNREKGKLLVAEAKAIARQADSWITLSNALTDPNGGLIVRYFPDSAERQAFLRSPAYEQLNQLLRETIRRRGLSPRRSHSRPSQRPAAAKVLNK
jgi:hypothetical protein